MELVLQRVAELKDAAHATVPTIAAQEVHIGKLASELHSIEVRQIASVHQFAAVAWLLFA